MEVAGSQLALPLGELDLVLEKIGAGGSEGAPFLLLRL